MNERSAFENWATRNVPDAILIGQRGKYGEWIYSSASMQLLWGCWTYAQGCTVQLTNDVQEAMPETSSVPYAWSSEVDWIDGMGVSLHRREADARSFTLEMANEFADTPICTAVRTIPLYTQPHSGMGMVWLLRSWRLTAKVRRKEAAASGYSEPVSQGYIKEAEAYEGCADRLEKLLTGEVISDSVSVEWMCRAWCEHNGWNPDEPVTYSGTKKKVREPNGNVTVQWQMHVEEAKFWLSVAMARKTDV